MQSSEEIRRVINRWLMAVTSGDADPSLERLSGHHGALTIGTDPDEWWHGPETRAVWGRQLEELGGMPVTWDEIEAWEEGTVAWAAAKMTVEGVDHTYTVAGHTSSTSNAANGSSYRCTGRSACQMSRCWGHALTVSLEQLEGRSGESGPICRGPSPPTVRSRSSLPTSSTRQF